jgi:hypothetical protein
MPGGSHRAEAGDLGEGTLEVFDLEPDGQQSRDDGLKAIDSDTDPRGHPIRP